MKVLFIGSVFSRKNEKEIIANSKTTVEYSANIFQEKLIRGFKEIIKEIEVLSAPGIGAFPNAYKKSRFTGFLEQQNEYKYVNFNNVWGLRNFSRAKALKKALKSYIQDKAEEKLIVVYSAHTPFLEAAFYAKRKDPSIKVCLIVPDLPMYMNLNNKISLIYKIGKKYDVRKFNRLCKCTDFFVLLTEQMKNKLPVGDKPFFVVEGIIDNIKESDVDANKDGFKYVVYTGKLNEKFGVNNLIDAFCLIKDENFRLILCGTGDSLEYAKQKASEDVRIICKGQVTPDEVYQWQKKASVLVNPRQNIGEYTKYSFPSKNIEYLLSGRPLVAYKLDGMKNEYDNFVFYPKDESVEELSKTIQETAKKDYNNKLFLQYAEKNLIASSIANRILKQLES